MRNNLVSKYPMTTGVVGQERRRMCRFVIIKESGGLAMNEESGGMAVKGLFRIDLASRKCFESQSINHLKKKWYLTFFSLSMPKRSLNSTLE
jgi:hypothetical protein